MSTSSTTPNLIADDVYCPTCGYNLRASVSDRCTECGSDITVIRSAESFLPWAHRRKIGFLRAYWKTVWMVVFRTPRFCLEMSRPVDEGDARAFRRVTIALAYVPILVFLAALALLRRDGFEGLVHIGGYAYLGVLVLAPLIAFISMTGAPFYVIRHPDMPLHIQLRAATLSLYCGAPLSVMGLAFACAIAGLIASRLSKRDWDLGWYTLGVGVFLVLLVVILMDVQRVIRWMLGGSQRSFRINARLFLAWFFCGMLSFVALPAAAALVAFIWFSLR